MTDVITSAVPASWGVGIAAGEGFLKQHTETGLLLN